MDLPATTQILKSREIRVLHLESSDVCQAACPLCARETDPNFDSSVKHNLTVDLLASILPEDFVRNLQKMFMCGNYGDPAANHQTLAIYQWFRTLNKGIVLGMNTNGALQNTFWWHQLAKILDQPQDYVVFSIDGLENTNSDYRVNVSWKILMQNVEAFIAAGGSAHWDMLVYKHNQHQVDECEKLARDMGFRWFRAKVSKRPLTGGLEFPVSWQPPSRAVASITCHALGEQSLYIDAQGRVSPCCWLGSRQRDFVQDFEEIKQSWASDNPNPICHDTCGGNDGRTRFADQWQRQTQLR